MVTCGWMGSHSGSVSSVVELARRCRCEASHIQTSTCEGHLAQLAANGGRSPGRASCRTCGHVSPLEVVDVREVVPR